MKLQKGLFYKTRTGTKVYVSYKQHNLWDYYDAKTHKRITDVYSNGRVFSDDTDSAMDLVSIWTPTIEAGKTYKTRDGQHEVLVERNTDPHFQAFPFIGTLETDGLEYVCYYLVNGQMDSVLEQDFDLVAEVPQKDVQKDVWEIDPYCDVVKVLLNGEWKASFENKADAEAWMASQQ